MQPSGSDKQGLPNFPGRPVSPFAAAPPRSMTPFASTGPIVGQDTSNAPRTSLPYQPSMPMPRPGAAHPLQNTMAYAPPKPVGSSEATVSGAVSPGQISGPSSPPQASSYPTKTTGKYPRFPPPSFPPAAQVPQGGSYVGAQIPPPIGTRPPSVPMGPPVITPPPLPSTFPLSGPPQAHMPPYSSMPPRGSVPLQQIDSSFATARPGLQPYLQPSPVAHVSTPPVHPPFHAHQGGFAPPPPVSVPLGASSRAQFQQLGSAPPTSGALQNLFEEFQSMSIGSTPGSIDAGIDLKSLPRPLDSGVDSTSVAETHPLNCHPRYLRLTTHAIPNSQSLLSRWHLPLGAVVHPLAESPDGVSYTLHTEVGIRFLMIIVFVIC